MAITPRTILTSAAPATVAVVSLYFFTILGTAAFTWLNNTDGYPVDRLEIGPLSTGDAVYQLTACDHVAEQFGQDRMKWSEYAWANYAHCFHQKGDSDMVLRTASAGLEHHPRSEILYNLKGIHYSLLEDYASAVETLREGMERVEYHRSGMMANNLAWAGLWEPRMMRLDEARSLYVEALARSPQSCAILHTGLFVEFGISSQSHGLERFDALKRFNDLRNQYNRCLDRLDNADWLTLVELAGAAVLFDQIDGTGSDNIQPLLGSTSRVFEEKFGDVSTETLCSEAMPLADYHHHCIDALEGAIDARAERQRQHSERNQRAAEVRNELAEDLQSTRQMPRGCPKEGVTTTVW